MAPKTKAEKEKNQNIQVAVRCRPLNSIEKQSGSFSIVNAEKREITIKERASAANHCATKTFTFDKVYSPQSKQIDVYKGVVVPILDEVLMGYNCTVFAYGQTGSGKTYSMIGERSVDDSSLSWENDPEAGIIPRCLHQLFESLKMQDVEYSVRVSYLELYNEELFDLLAGGDDSQRLRIYEDNNRKGSVVIQGLEEVTVHNKDEVYHILEKGQAKRRTAATLMNASSSRSHSVFSVTIHIKENSIDGEELLKTGKLNLVDLAGSENIGRSGAVDKRAREAGNINQSLLTLGRVITALVEHAPHVPYRESKLTRLLQDSLGGRTKTSIIATISPASCNLEETLSTLDYAHRAKNIMNRPEINQKFSKKALLKEYTEELERLRRDLQAARDKSGVYLDSENYNSIQVKLVQNKDTIESLQGELAVTAEEFAKITEMFNLTKVELEEREEQLEQTRHDLHDTRFSLQRTTTERDEQTHLVGEHVKAEKQLLGQAKQLLTTANTTTSDIGGLHAKLDRKRAVEEENASTEEKFLRSFNERTEAMQGRIGSFLTDQKAMHDGLTNSMNSGLARRLEGLNNVSGLVQTTCRDVNGRMDQLSHKQILTTDYQMDWSSQLQERITEQDRTVSATVSKLQSGCIHPTSASIQRCLHEEMEALTDFGATLKRQMAALQQCTSQFVSSIQTSCGQLRERVHDLDDMKRRLADHEQTIHTTLAEESEQAEALKTRLAADINKLIDAALCEVTDVKTQKSEELSSALKSSQVLLGDVREKVENVTESLEIESDAHFSSFTNETRQMVDSQDLTLQNLVSMTSSVEEEESSLCRSVVDALTTYKEDSHTFTLSTVQTICDNIQAVEEANRSHRQYVQETSQLLTERVTLVSQQVHENSTIDQSEVLSRVTSLEDMASGVECMCSELQRKTEQTDDVVQQFVRAEVKKDAPTGKTPQRRDYHYPRRLIVTKTHNKLLSDYRDLMDKETLERVAAVPLPDLNLTDLEDEGMESIASGISTLSLSSLSSSTTEFDKTEDLYNEDVKENYPPSKKDSKNQKNTSKSTNIKPPQIDSTPRSKLPLKNCNSTPAK